MNGLRKFKRHSLYANVTNDRTVAFYTSAIEKTNPYSSDLAAGQLNFLKGWEGLILDSDDPLASGSRHEPIRSTMAETSKRWLKRTPLVLAGTGLLPVAVTLFLLSAAYQTVRSASRIRLHEAGLAGINIEEYRISLWMKEMREEVERAYETLNNTQDQSYLDNEDHDEDEDVRTDPERHERLAVERRKSIPGQPTLALTVEQFAMIDSLNSIRWRKYPVWIHEHRHTHAAIIVRMDKEGFHEGSRVLSHFSTTEFLI